MPIKTITIKQNTCITFYFTGSIMILLVHAENTFAANLLDCYCYVFSNNGCNVFLRLDCCCHQPSAMRLYIPISIIQLSFFMSTHIPMKHTT